MNRVIHFEVMAEDPERAEKFYKEVFGWEITKWGGPAEYRLVTTGKDGAGINGGIAKSKGGPLTVNTMNVPDLDKALEKVKKSGGKQVADRMTVPGVGYLAYCQDTEGIVFGMMQEDANAK
jgi:predicted enzyme related to lactoylglutathione lyase